MATEAEQQLLDQNALIADALYDVALLLTMAGQDGGGASGWEQDLKTKVNALNPAKFTFS